MITRKSDANYMYYRIEVTHNVLNPTQVINLLNHLTKYLISSSKKSTHPIEKSLTLEEAIAFVKDFRFTVRKSIYTEKKEWILLNHLELPFEPFQLEPTTYCTFIKEEMLNKEGISKLLGAECSTAVNGCLYIRGHYKMTKDGNKYTIFEEKCTLERKWVEEPDD